MPGQLVFVSTGPPAASGKVDRSMRKLIRRHVMLGKNKSTKRRASPTAHGPSVPRKLGTDFELAHIPWPSTIHRRDAVEAIHNLVTITRARHALGACLTFTPLALPWLQQLTTDAAFLQSVILMVNTQAVLANPNMDRDQQTSRVHFIKTLALLRARIDDLASPATTVAATSNSSSSTVFCVVNLASHALLHRDAESARQHLMAARKLIDLQGGFDTLASEPKIQLEIVRADVGTALQGGSSPLFMDERLDLLPIPQEIHTNEHRQRTVPDHIETGEDIATVWCAMRKFSDVINTSATASGKIPWALLYQTTATVLYRLLRAATAGADVGQSAEVIRLGLLTYCTTIFLQGQDSLADIKFRDLQGRFATALQGTSQDGTAVWIWLLMMGCFLDKDDAVLRERLGAALKARRITSWSQMRLTLGEVMWMPLVHDARGLRIFGASQPPPRC